MNTDRIEREVLLKAGLSRVWQAIANADEFGRWFGVRFDGPFRAGERLHGVIVPTEVDQEVAKSQEPYSGASFEIVVDQIDPERLFSFRWHPFAIDEKTDYSVEPMTLVSFELHERSEGVLLKLSESGFDHIPLARRAAAFSANEGGWSAQIKLIEKYLAIFA